MKNVLMLALVSVFAATACATHRPVYRPSDSAGRARDGASPTGGGPMDPNVSPRSSGSEEHQPDARQNPDEDFDRHPPRW